MVAELPFQVSDVVDDGGGGAAGVRLDVPGDLDAVAGGGVHHVTGEAVLVTPCPHQL